MAKKNKKKILYKSNVSKKTAAVQNIIKVKNAEGETDTQATVIVKNNINYTPKVSVIIPVYNVAEYLPECLDSVIKQTLKEIEIICVDDSSTDNSVEILKEYASKDNRITVIVQKNLHAGVARNAGLAVAKGKYLSFLDSDDFFEPTLLEENYKIAEKENVDLVFYQYHTYNNDTKEIERTGGINFECPVNEEGYGVISVKDVTDRIFTICNPMPWNKLIRKDLIDKNQIRFQSLTASNDVYFSLVALACSDKIALFYKPFVYYRHNRKDSLKNNRDKNPFNFYEAYKGVYRTLNNKNLYDEYKSSFLRTLVSSSFWTMEHTDAMRTTVRNFIKERIVPEFNITGSDKEQLPKHLIDKLNRLEEPEVIISLTSFPARIGTVNQTIESLLNQTMKADRVILWLAPEQFPNKEADLPQELLDLREKGLTIDWYHDIRSYKKLIPALKKYPDAIIVTADDDLIFKNNWLSLLYSAYLKDKTKIWSHRITRLYRSSGKMHILDRSLYLNENGDYKQELKFGNAFNKLTGGAGSLYPPKSLHPDVMDEDAFMKLAPTSDDIWFWIQAIRNGFKVAVVDNNLYKLQYVPGSQEESLYKINDAGGHSVFFTHLNNIMANYKDVEKIFNEDQKENEQALKETKKALRNKYKDQLCDWYKRVTGHYLNLDNPKRFNEKIQWLKLYASTPIKTRLADKFLVRDWVKEKIGEEYLIPLLGVYDKFEDIDFSKLPDRFVIKCNHGCAYNIIVKDKSQLDLAEVKAKLDKWMSENFAFRWGYELQYRDIPPKIIIEKYMEDESGELRDYKISCFNGQPEFIWIDSDRFVDHKRNLYDINWNQLNCKVNSRYNTFKSPEKPKCLAEMIELAKVLSKEFQYVRVDFYIINGKLYFGEMTFTSSSGTEDITPKSFEAALARKIKLPKLAYDIDTGEYYKLPKKSRLKSYLLFPYYLYKLKGAKKEYKNITIKNIEKQLLAIRLDVKNNGAESNNIDVVAPNTRISKPLWMKNAQGQGAVLESNETELHINITAVGDGVLRLAFKAADKRYDGKRLTVYVDYTSIKIDGKELLKEPMAIWHDIPFVYEMPVKNGQKVDVLINVHPHKYTRSDLQDLILKLNPKSSYIIKNISSLLPNINLSDTEKIHFTVVKELPSIDADIFIPIGNARRPAYWLRENGLRKVALPFDWMMSYPLNVVSRAFNYSVEEWFKDNYEKNSENTKFRAVTDANMGMISLHHFPKSVSVEEYLPEFRSIFVERQQRMLNLLRTKKAVCFVANRLEDVPEIINFLKIVTQTFPNIHNLTFINVRHSDTEDSIKLYKISDNIKLYEVTAYDVNSAGSDPNKNALFWIGKEDLWISICSKLHLKNEEIPESYKKKISFCGLNFYVHDKHAELMGAVQTVRNDVREELRKEVSKIEHVEKNLVETKNVLENVLKQYTAKLSSDIVSAKNDLNKIFTAQVTELKNNISVLHNALISDNKKISENIIDILRHNIDDLSESFSQLLKKEVSEGNADIKVSLQNEIKDSNDELKALMKDNASGLDNLVIQRTKLSTDDLRKSLEALKISLTQLLKEKTLWLNTDMNKALKKNSKDISTDINRALKNNSLELNAYLTRANKKTQEGVISALNKQVDALNANLSQLLRSEVLELNADIKSVLKDTTSDVKDNLAKAMNDSSQNVIIALRNDVDNLNNHLHEMIQSTSSDTEKELNTSISQNITVLKSNIDALNESLVRALESNLTDLKRNISDINLQFDVLNSEQVDFRKLQKEQIKELSEKLNAIAGLADELVQENIQMSGSVDAVNNNIKEEFLKKTYELRTIIEYMDVVITDIKDNITNKIDDLPEKIEKKQRVIATINSEPYWANIYHDTIISSSWLKDKAVSPGRWAVSYIVLYVLYRVLNEFRPKNILECGLGQSSKLTAQYVEANGGQLTICEDSKDWASFFKKSFPIADKYIHLLGLEMVEVVKPYESRTYVGFDNVIKGKKFDFIIVDGPLGSPRYSRPELLDVVDNLAQSFVIMLDDVNREGEQDTWNLLKTKLVKKGIIFNEKIYTSDKSVGLLCSPDLKFLTSL